MKSQLNSRRSSCPIVRAGPDVAYGAHFMTTVLMKRFHRVGSSNLIIIRLLRVARAEGRHQAGLLNTALLRNDMPDYVFGTIRRTMKSIAADWRRFVVVANMIVVGR